MRRPVVLASLDWIRPGDPRTGLGVASIASSLAQAGVEVEVVGDAVNRGDFDGDAYIQRVVSSVGAAGPDALCGVAAFVWNEPEVVRLVSALRENTAAEIILGGPQVSYVGPGGLEGLYPGANYFVRGNAETAAVALATGGPTDGLGIHRAGMADTGERADLTLDALPSPHLDGTLTIGRNVRWETQRGCPFSCTFCQHREPGNRLKNRHLPDGRILAEAAAFAAGGVERISVLDPIFNANRARAVRLLERFNALGLRAQLSLQCRFELIDDAFLDAVTEMDVQLEFGLQTIHPVEGQVIRRPNRLDRAEAVVAELHRRGIAFEVSLIYGLPLQTVDSFCASVDWCLARSVPRVRAWPLMLLRGTPLFEERARWGLIESTGDRIPIVVESASFTRADHEDMALIAAHLEDAERPQPIARPA